MGIQNALTIDVEEWFHVSLFRKTIRREEWYGLQSTVLGNTCRILNLLAEKRVKATFFILGWVAERYPEIV
ncbi:MAG: polysaccharide deacetylase family protein, partial [bacterium]